MQCSKQSASDLRFEFFGFLALFDRGLFRILIFGFRICALDRSQIKTRTLKTMNESRTGQYDLEDRTFIFAKDVRAFVKQIPKTLANIEDIKQVVRASGSVGANYIEANESLSKKDFLNRIKICRKEAKECRYWLRLIDAGDDSGEKFREDLVREATELTSIFGAILRKSE
ncbi:MAG TPA: four helix bundle protein [Candidatus Binatia bacterium]|nr:four helix bundle protein [Candidatus Binatia bacterium]